MAIERARTQRPEQGRTVVHSDSLYAINMTTGKWRPKVQRNIRIIEALREAWREVHKARPGEVSLQHVRSHIGVPGNELADHLATLGTQAPESEVVCTTRAASWIDKW